MSDDYFKLITSRNQPQFSFVDSKVMDPRNPTVIQARTTNSEYIVFCAQDRNNRWNFERVSDGAIIASGSLEAMLSLLTLYPNSRRATWAEDMGRYTPYCFTQAAAYDNRLYKILEDKKLLK